MREAEQLLMKDRRVRAASWNSTLHQDVFATSQRLMGVAFAQCRRLPEIAFDMRIAPARGVMGRSEGAIHFDAAANDFTLLLMDHASQRKRRRAGARR
jgi:hypothetical protein